MLKWCSYSLILLLTVALWSCGDEDNNGPIILGPDVPKAGPGEAEVFTVRQVSFPTVDSVEVSALFGLMDSDEARPVVILVHDVVDESKEEWLRSTSLFSDLLRRGYHVLAIDLRGHGATLLPEDRQPLSWEDVEESFLDVGAALTWLRSQRKTVDAARVAVVGTGVGGNVAYVSMGVFPRQIKTAVCLSPGAWAFSDQIVPIVIGEGLTNFNPHSILFMVGDQDVLTLTDGTQLSYLDFAAFLFDQTADPSNVLVLRDSADHGLAILDDNPQAREFFFSWLEDRL
jgi:pimeloyl-ACP methyl ester carboxylesterase